MTPLEQLAHSLPAQGDQIHADILNRLRTLPDDAYYYFIGLLSERARSTDHMVRITAILSLISLALFTAERISQTEEARRQAEEG
jgi:hypothetical protein